MTATEMRELLELAAKAVGYTTAHKWNSERLRLDPPVVALVVHDGGELVSTGWNPLTDDGHALRLAVKLFIFVDTAAGAADSFGAELVRAGNEVVDCVEPRSNCDPYAATRRAIVRAAAAIGRAMP